MLKIRLQLLDVTYIMDTFTIKIYDKLNSTRYSSEVQTLCTL